MDSGISGFYRLTPQERLEMVCERAGLKEEGSFAISGEGLNVLDANRMIENCIGTFEVPLGIAVNFRVNGSDYLVPMATEEPSVVAAASNAAKMIRSAGGFCAESKEPVMIGQIQVKGAKDGAIDAIIREKASLMEYAQSLDPTLESFGGGIRDIRIRDVGDYLVLHILVNVADAMGANIVNTMCEALAPKIEGLGGGRCILKILSNHALERTARASCLVSAKALGGDEVVERIIDAQMLAETDIYRAVTHNKGVMNGITAVVLATGNDTRAIEAGCHAYAAKDGAYRPLTRWSVGDDGDLRGEIEVPVAVGLVGGATRTHPVARAALDILGVKSSRELSQVIACVGLAQNLAAIRALSDEGIQRGHMGLHAKNIARLAGVDDEMIDDVAKKMAESGRVSVDEAKRLGNLRLS